MVQSLHPIWHQRAMPCCSTLIAVDYTFMGISTKAHKFEDAQTIAKTTSGSSNNLTAIQRGRGTTAPRASASLGSLKRCTEKQNSPSFSFALKQSQDIIDSNGAFNVSDDRTARVVHELDADLDDTSSRSRSAEHLRRI